MNFRQLNKTVGKINHFILEQVTQILILYAAFQLEINNWSSYF